MEFLDDINFSGPNFIFGAVCGVIGTLIFTTVF